MENRFGFKEFVLVVLLLAVLVSVWVGIYQFDRQWSAVQSITATLQDQSDQLERINKHLSNAVAMKPAEHTSPTSAPNNPATTQGAVASTQGPSTQAAATKPSGPFARILAARRMTGYAVGGWCIQSFGQNLSSINPLTSSDVYASVIQNYVLESLASRDPQTLKWKPLIARSWHVSKDGLTISFNLRHGVTFSDGSPLTSADVRYTYNLIMNPRIAAPRSRAYYDNIASVTAPNPYKVVFKLKNPYFKAFEICATMTILPKHFYSKFTPQQFNNGANLLMGSGPYKVAAGPQGWQPGSGKIQLVRNNNYWGVEPALNRIVFRTITDPTARLTAFRNGSLDEFGPNPQQYVKLKNDQTLLKKNALYHYYSPGSGYMYVGWNELSNGKKTPFADVRVRQAMTMLINRKLICKQLMEGLARQVNSPFAPGTPQYDTSIKPWPFDPAKAKKLLAQAGYNYNASDGVIEGPQNTPLAFNLIYPSSSKTSKAIAYYLKDAFAQAGIIMRPEPLEWSIMLQRTAQRNYDAMLIGWSGDVESDPYQIFDSSQIGDGGDNSIHYVNHKLDHLIETARRTIDESKRMKLWHEVSAVLHHDQPFTFLFQPKSVRFVSNRIHNVQITTMGMNSPTEWFIPQALQRWSK